MRRILAITTLMILTELSANAQVDENDQTTNTELQRNLDSVENNTRAEDVNLDTINTEENTINSVGETLDPDASKNKNPTENGTKDAKPNNMNKNRNLKTKNR